MIAEEFAMDPRPDEPAIGIDVDLGHAEFRRRQVLVFVHPAGRGVELAAGGVDAFDFLNRDARAAVHDDGSAGNPLLDFLDDVEMKALLALELIGAMARADGGGE